MGPKNITGPKNAEKDNDLETGGTLYEPGGF